MLAILVYLLFYSAEALPVFIKSGVQSDSGHNHHNNIYDKVAQQGYARYADGAGYNQDSVNKFIKAQDHIKFDEASGNSKHLYDEGKHNDENFNANSGGHVEDFGKKAAHKKGHHKSGYRHSYHKDETGENTSFYDDANDEGDVYQRQSNKGSYGSAQSAGHKDHHLVKQGYDGSYGKHGDHHKGEEVAHNAANQNGYNENNYNDGHEAVAHKDAGEHYGGGRNYVEANHIERPHYHDLSHYPDRPPYNRVLYNPYYPTTKRTITIYEDPRYYNDAGNFDGLRHDNHHDPVNLEFRRPLPRQPYDYYDKPHNNDYYYY